MSTPDGGDEVLRGLEIEVQEEIGLAEASHPETEAELPATEWLFDPTDVEREEVGLRSLLDAVETMEHPGDKPV
ncbi:hypothetical protein [Flindersiella endophytica]